MAKFELRGEKDGNRLIATEVCIVKRTEDKAKSTKKKKVYKNKKTCKALPASITINTASGAAASRKATSKLRSALNRKGLKGLLATKGKKGGSKKKSKSKGKSK